MKTIFYIDGGAGRVITAIPALLKYHKLNPNSEWAIIVPGFDSLYWGIPELQDRTYSTDTKGVFENVIKNADRVITPEPYRVPAYFRQEISLSEAFDREINNTTNHSDLQKPHLVLNKNELTIAKNTIAELRNHTKKTKTIIIQPYGRGAKIELDKINDEESRSLDSQTYLALVKILSQYYNCIFFGESNLQLDTDTYTQKYICDLRQWAALIAEADYFVGIDSVGQHMAYTLNKPGTVILGSTYAVNTSYPNYFNILEKTDVKKYSPIRLTGLDSALANRLNEHTMLFNDQEVQAIATSIIDDIEDKVKS